jgi:pimeloyl-ACP methyl ester carboxylesterase
MTTVSTATSVLASCGHGCPVPAVQRTLLAHEIHGSGPEKVLVFHSWMGNARSFDALKPFLDTDTYTYAFADLRGYGRSRSLRGEYTAAEATADAFYLADRLEWKRFHAVGHSMSGMIVQRMILDDWKRRDHRIRSAVAITPVSAGGYPADATTKQFLWGLIHDVTLTAQGIAGLTGGRLPARWSELMARQNIDTSDAEAMRGYYRMWIDGDFSEEAAAVRPGTPLRVIGGRQDLPGFDEAKYRESFAVWYPNVDLQFITDAGHFPMHETPAYLATLIESHLHAHRTELQEASK